ncbi:LacI family DNA-binding transcriptional regulator [Streptomyces sp. NPDC047880]|uniref:LacI family DNA-binding transcriptional regulator n=1 Tax=Streptomyces sp. NPDC047880 TaxID=3155626 RepID=UPI00345248A8
MKIGITEVAARAGVSEATVSRVVNRRPGVSRGARAKVEEAMAALGYRRPPAGQLVAVVTEHISNPFFADLAERLEAALAPHGLKTVICPAFTGGVPEQDFISVLMGRGLAAVVFLSVSNTLDNADTTPYEMLRDRQIPYVGIDGQFGDGVPAPVYSTDSLQAAELAVAHLHGLGHRRIGMVSGPQGNQPADLRASGFLTAMADRGVEDADRWLIRQSYTIEGGQAAAGVLTKMGVTGIVAASDFMALGAIRGIRRSGLSVPCDVSVVGYDGTMLTEFVDPPLTTVRQPTDRLAVEVARSVRALLAGQDVPNGELLFAPELVVRSTTAPPPAGSADEEG